MALVGKKAPSFTAAAVINGEEIVENFSELISIQKLMIICNLLQYSKSMEVATWGLNQRMMFFIKR